jgi:23S rRNA U2552 (ribose-2'-O)-methylase RlmE/FtsJ
MDILMQNNFFTIGFRAKNSIDKVKEIIPKELKNPVIFDLLHKFQGQTEVDLLILDSVIQAAIKFILIMNQS